MTRKKKREMKNNRMRMEASLITSHSSSPGPIQTTIKMKGMIRIEIKIMRKKKKNEGISNTEINF